MVRERLGVVHDPERARAVAADAKLADQAAAVDNGYPVTSDLVIDEAAGAPPRAKEGDPGALVLEETLKERMPSARRPRAGRARQRTCVVQRIRRPAHGGRTDAGHSRANAPHSSA